MFFRFGIDLEIFLIIIVWWIYRKIYRENGIILLFLDWFWLINLNIFKCKFI